MKKVSYTVPCPSRFRDAVLASAERRGVNAADLARSILLLLPPETIAAEADPGDPAADDREEVILKSGKAAGRPWRRKPRLQVRLPEGFDPVAIRKALALALAMEDGSAAVAVETAETRAAETEDVARLKGVIEALAFVPLATGVTTRAEALHVLGYAPGASPDRQSLRRRFRELAAIHHPDSGLGTHQRMAQLNAAMDVLRG